MMHRHFSRPLAAAAVLLLAACQDGASPTTPSTLQSDDAPSMARSAQAQARLEAIFQRTSPAVMELPGTVFADNDEAAGKVVFGVEHIGIVRGVQEAMARQGVSPDDYAIELVAPIRFAQGATPKLTSSFRPVPAGVQIHFGQYVCTLGFNVSHPQYGTAFVTNSHCTNTQGGTEGTQYWQASRTANPVAIATEVLDPSYQKGGQLCPRGKKCRYSDASLAQYAVASDQKLARIAKTTGANNGSLDVAGEFTITDDANAGAPVVGTVVNKVGRTTGWTQGEVTRTCVNTSVQGSTVYLLCQNFVAAGVGGGDSGSPVFTGTSNVKLVGILWGGSGDALFVYSPLAQVRQELGNFAAQ